MALTYKLCSTLGFCLSEKLKGECKGEYVDMQLGVGRLGIVTEVDFMILRQRMITRTVTPQSFWEFVDWTQALQDGYNRALASGSDAAISAALSPIDMTQVCLAH